MSDIDKDIQVVKDLIEYSQNMINDMEYERPVEITIYKEDIQAIENILSELENKDKQIKLEIKGRDTLVNLNTELSKELETYKKKAEKLAVKMIYLPISEDGVFYCTKEAVIDWARKEVENEQV